jgi:hypothetical protein
MVMLLKVLSLKNNFNSLFESPFASAEGLFFLLYVSTFHRLKELLKTHISQCPSPDLCFVYSKQSLKITHVILKGTDNYHF